MTDHKFTDDEIIKALECCRTVDGDDCSTCPYRNKIYELGLGGCVNDLVTDALALINHQKVEIESLKIANEKMYAASEEQEAEIERLQAVHADMTESLRLASEANKDMQAEIEKLGRDRYQVLPDGRLELIPRTDINAIKAEAIKEFAKKIKTDAEWICDDNYIGGALIEYVDTLVKEMTEENK